MFREGWGEEFTPILMGAVGGGEGSRKLPRSLGWFSSLLTSLFSRATGPSTPCSSSFAATSAVRKWKEKISGAAYMPPGLQTRRKEPF